MSQTLQLTKFSLKIPKFSLNVLGHTMGRHEGSARANTSILHSISRRILLSQFLKLAEFSRKIAKFSLSALGHTVGRHEGYQRHEGSERDNDSILHSISRAEQHTAELQKPVTKSYADFC